MKAKFSMDAKTYVGGKTYLFEKTSKKGAIKHGLILYFANKDIAITLEIGQNFKYVRYLNNWIVTHLECIFRGAK